MNLNDYLLREVEPEEFVELKRQEADLVKSGINSLNDHWKPKVQGIKITFRYNTQRKFVGIYVERNGQSQLVVERKGLSESEGAIVGSLYQTLEERLDRLRLPKEEWVESIPK